MLNVAIKRGVFECLSGSQRAKHRKRIECVGDIECLHGVTRWMESESGQVYFEGCTAGIECRKTDRTPSGRWDATGEATILNVG